MAAGWSAGRQHVSGRSVACPTVIAAPILAICMASPLPMPEPPPLTKAARPSMVPALAQSFANVNVRSIIADRLQKGCRWGLYLLHCHHVSGQDRSASWLALRFHPKAITASPWRSQV